MHVQNMKLSGQKSTHFAYCKMERSVAYGTLVVQATVFTYQKVNDRKLQ